MKHFYLTLSLILAISISFGQNEKNHWFFGQNAYIDFNTATPTVTTGNLNTGEGCSSVADASGNLLFYTDGRNVYDSTNTTMPNGTNLKGDPSSTHSSLVVANPCNPDLYYIFTAGARTIMPGLHYYEVDMCLNGGLGDVVVGSETLLLADASEKIAATLNANGQDIWVSSTKENSSISFAEIYTWGVTCAGVSLTPNVYVSSQANTSATNGTQCNTDGNDPGQIKFNNSGDVLAVAQLYCSREIDVYSFDNVTGNVTSFVTALTDTTGGAYGLEFSPDDNYLFATDYFLRSVWQYDISNITSIPTPVQLGSNIGTRGGALQLAPDGMSIYAAQMNTNNLAQITNITSFPATFSNNSITLAGGTLSRLGLPTFASGMFSSSPFCLNLDPFTNAVPTLFSTVVKDELNTNPFFGKDKEYGDVDNDGDMDILYTKTGDELFILENTAGPGVTPVYSVPGTSAFGPNFLSYSYRFIDWNGDSFNDILVSGIDASGDAGIWLFLNNGSGGFPASGLPFINAGLPGPDQYGFSDQDLIAVGDLNNDGLHDILISNQSGTLNGTAYFENLGVSGGPPPYFGLTGSQMYVGGTINNPFIPDNSGSYHTPEIYDADCDGDLDVFISDPLLPSPTFGGARMYFHENNGAVTTGTLPDVNLTGVINQFGFNDDPGTSSDLACDWIITRIIPYINPNCPIAISYNLCDEEFFYYDQDCGCEGTGTNVVVLDTEELQNPRTEIALYPNPASSHFKIESEATITGFMIYDMQGREVMQHTYTGKPVQIDRLSQGMYFVKVNAFGGIQTLRLIVE
ncbi:T9SS type A sorting domain-containing protein [Marinirhabdus gelatinilytica]|uniref:Putative secreted protein (Por secretion system target) n=1 Tax=Marinirhabdus gelatinilytica TaxID=1703343 RepID=A0A370QJP2_9FLAO|nr:T9SS type A sorting domain-containing protein [Marinirhabdus gelatinilytica]RDK88583.1 putative secreted protein (Por secretion system target) [Marinirhabdus gelatinilytica]